MALMLGGAESLETLRIRTEESLKYGIDIGIIWDEMKYGIARVQNFPEFIRRTTLFWSTKKFLDGFEQLGPMRRDHMTEMDK